MRRKYSASSPTRTSSFVNKCHFLEACHAINQSQRRRRTSQAPYRRFVLRDVEGLSTEETAEHLSIKPETVKTRLHRARRMLRINAEIVDLFSQQDLSGAIRFGVPDDYAVRLLPVILSTSEILSTIFPKSSILMMLLK